MNHLFLALVATSPIAIRADHSEGGAATAKYIPGSTLLGSLSAAHRMLRPRQDDEFKQFFLAGQILFPHLYPAGFKSSSAGLDEANTPVKPLPRTAQMCKRFSGFRPLHGENALEERHGIRDSLLDWAVFALLDARHQPLPGLLAPLEVHDRCAFPGCEQALDHADGYYRSDLDDSRQRMRASAATRLQTRTGINRDWGVVENSILYNREVFEDGTMFWGDLLFPDEETLPEEQRLVTRFQDFLLETEIQDQERPGIVRLGTGRSRGLGCVALAKDLIEVERETLPAFQKRLEKFDTLLRTESVEQGVKGLDAFYFAITLTSATILRDPFLRYQKTLDVATLARLLDHARASFTLIYQATGMQRVTGWNELWGTPRQHDYALEMGSTFLFASSVEPDAELLEALYALEETGLGERRAEGFGRICVSDPFHLEREQL
ncbi:MAG TPA: RAMP superfamily CRISPR-associated protein [Ktedonobacteraceae bacterium]